MALSPGARIGSYDVTGALGAGGMGEVYRARDAKLQRDVAIKVLPAGFAHDVERVARFEREARTLASLNHPNIAHVYGLEDTGGSKALVMELVEGPTLADRIAVGPVPVAEAVRIARQIVDALEAAHEQGIVHRDLKPANIKVTPDGVVKVLDFGLAKIAEPAVPSSSSMSQLPTITTPAMTQAGVILGTAAYMSPEQAKGRPTDKRSDIWAFGCVLYEMLTGRRPFEGEDVADTLAFMLTKEPDWSALPADTPDYLRTLLRRCLEKDRKARVPDIAVVRFQLDDAARAPTATRPSGGATDRPMAARERVAWAVGLLACLGAGTWALLQNEFGQVSQAPVVRFTVPPPGGGIFTGANSTPRLAVSPDGQYVAFTADARDGRPHQLWVRRLDTLEISRVTNITETGGEPVQQPFWSPGSDSIGFYQNEKIRRVSLDGGGTQVITEAPGQNFGATWGEDDTILYSTSATAGVMRVSANGGAPLQVTRIDAAAGESAHLWPRLLPDGVHFLYQAHTAGDVSSRATYVGSLVGDLKVKVLESPLMVEFAEPDLLLFAQEGALMARRLDLKSFRLTGQPTLIDEAVQSAPVNGRLGVSASRTGVLAYRPGVTVSGADSQLAWIDRTGKELGVVGEPANLRGFELSPDGSRAAVHIDETDGRGDIWIADLGRGTMTRLTFTPEEHNLSPIWSRDGDRVLYSKRSKLEIYEKNANGIGSETLVYRNEDKLQGFVYPIDLSLDGKLIAFAGSANRSDILTASIGVATSTPFAASRAQEGSGDLSPDGRWLAYQSDEGGLPQVFAQSFPAGGTRFQVSISGGARPRWRADGREIFYTRGNAGAPLMSVRVEPGGKGLVFGAPQPLFLLQFVGATHDTPYFSYAPSPDGQRFLIARSSSAVGSTGLQTPLTVVLNWQAALR